MLVVEESRALRGLAAGGDINSNVSYAKIALQLHAWDVETLRHVLQPVLWWTS